MQRSLSSATAQRKAPDPPARRHSPSLARKTRSAQPQAVAVEPYCFAEWRVRRVGVDYHIELDAHFYSVPHRFAPSEVEVRPAPQTVEIFSKGERIATHRRVSGNRTGSLDDRDFGIVRHQQPGHAADRRQGPWYERRSSR